MPEGDTIWRTAARLRPAVLGRTVTRFDAPRLVGSVRPGTLVSAVEARGKYLLIGFDDGQFLETHMKMTGSWHLYRAAERWRRSRSAARVILGVDNGWTAVCFSAPHVRLGRLDAAIDDRPAGDRVAGGPRHLGPDLTSPDPDLASAAARFERFASVATPAAVALLDQRICCGVGNVYKSEVLHALGISPDRPVGALSAWERTEIVECAHRLLRSNLGGGARTTTGNGDLAVYGKAGKPCPRCGERIERSVHGEQARSTYWCPRCQR